MTKEEMLALEKKIASASEPSRALDDEIALALTKEFSALDGDPVLMPYTRSIDAAVYLADSLLPGWKWAVSSENHGVIDKPESSYIGDSLSGPGMRSGATPALALCAAIVAELAYRRFPT